VAVLMGGPGAERLVSLSTGQECASALRQAGYTVVEVDAGSVQGLLEWMGLPYTHSGVLCSALAMDKEKSKEVFRSVGLPVVDSLLMARNDLAGVHPMPVPYVIKPNNEGSSVGVYLVDLEQKTPPVLSEDMPDIIMVETFAPGRELTTTVVGDRALTVTDILTDTWYDYDAKYVEGGSKHVVPAKLPDEIFQACLDYAVKAHQVLGCRSISRTDFRWDDTLGISGLILLETNTQPGMTPTSLSPEQAAAVGISFSDLCSFLVEDASCSR
jgi:D-alanine-D-alanine ligase